MSIQIDFTDETGELKKADFLLLEKLISFAATTEKITEEAEVSIIFVTNEAIREINRTYRDKDDVTDVISFALEEIEEEEIEFSGLDIPRVLGDIIISVSRTHEQAEEYGHSFQRELGFLALHGFLHLLGYDHMTAEEEAGMFRKQKEILDAYGLTR